MLGHYGSLIAGNRSRRALSAVRSITDRADDFQIHRIALCRIASHRIAETYCLRARTPRLDALASLIISRDGETERERER